MPYIENEILERLITTMVEGFARVEKKLDHMNRLKECLDGDKFWTMWILPNCSACRSVHLPVTVRKESSAIIA